MKTCNNIYCRKNLVFHSPNPFVFSDEMNLYEFKINNLAILFLKKFNNLSPLSFSNGVC